VSLAFYSGHNSQRTQCMDDKWFSQLNMPKNINAHSVCRHPCIILIFYFSPKIFYKPDSRIKVCVIKVCFRPALSTNRSHLFYAFQIRDNKKFFPTQYISSEGCLGIISAPGVIIVSPIEIIFTTFAQFSDHVLFSFVVSHPMFHFAQPTVSADGVLAPLFQLINFRRPCT